MCSSDLNKLAYLNAQSSGDVGDLASPSSSQPNLGADALNAFAWPGTTSLASADWFMMDALGWNLTAASGFTSQSNPPYVA